jgi:hypothetical protein
MKRCPYCGYSNYDQATACRKCDGSLVAAEGTLFKPKRFGPCKGKMLRNRALSAVAVGLLMKVYWGGYGPWPVTHEPHLLGLRILVEPLLLVGGVVLYLAGWVLNYI